MVSWITMELEISAVPIIRPMIMRTEVFFRRFMLRKPSLQITPCFRASSPTITDNDIASAIIIWNMFMVYP